MSRGERIRRIEATWWAPQRPDERLPGTIDFDDSGLVIRLAGSLSSVNFGAAAQTEVLLGESEDGRRHALHGCYLRVDRPGKEMKLGAEYLFEGAAPVALEEALFQTAYLQLEGLERWFRIWPFEIGSLEEEPGSILLRRGASKQVMVDLPDCTATLSDTVSTITQGQMEVRFGAAAVVEFRYPNPVAFTRVIQDCGRMQLLLSLLGNHVAEQRSLALLLPDQNALPVSVHFKSPYHSLASEGSIDDEIASFDDLADVFPIILTKWWSATEQLRLAVQLLVTTLGSSALEANFLSIAKAFEAYHRASMDGEYVTPMEYERVCEAMIGAIPQGIPEGLRNSLKSRVRFGNELSLRTRVKAVIADLDERFSSRFLRDPGVFIDRLVTTRNTLAHGLVSSEEEKSWKGVEMYYGSAKARQVLIACILQALGVPAPRVWDLSEKNARFRFLMARDS